MFSKKMLIFPLLVFNSIAISTAFQCMNEDHEPVDWFVIYKLPRLKNSSNPYIKTGTGYMFMTSDSYEEWKLSNLSINDVNSMVAITLNPFYSNQTEFSSIAYNDQPPHGSSEDSKGHNKGVVVASPGGGFWLIHSVPHFPPIPEYSYPDTGVVYGQSFLCVSLNSKNLNEIGIQLQYNEPQIYYHQIPSSQESLLPELARAAAGVTVQSAPWFRRTTIESLAGVTFTSFAKSKHFLKDLYEDWVAPALETNLFVETWGNGAGKLPSNCTKPVKVYNVETVTFKSLEITFASTHDHSKWAVSDGGQAWICIGDINRMEHQKSRGGGTVCLNNKILANDYHRSVTTVEKCRK